MAHQQKVFILQTKNNKYIDKYANREYYLSEDRKMQTSWR